jgi:hypothetical protein
MSTEDSENASGKEESADQTGETEQERPLNRAERRAQGKKAQNSQPFLGGGGSLPLGQRVHGGGPAGGKSRFNRKVGGK